MSESAVVDEIGATRLTQPLDGLPTVVHVLPKAGVTDPAGLTAQAAAAALGHRVVVRSLAAKDAGGVTDPISGAVRQDLGRAGEPCAWPPGNEFRHYIDWAEVDQPMRDGMGSFSNPLGLSK